MDNVIKVREREHMYFSLPITSTNNSHRLQSQIDQNNYICSIIVNSVYDFKIYDHNLKNGFYGSAK
jgi:hypothetical protein